MLDLTGIHTLGIFDSGVGGLTMVQALQHSPIRSIIYLADTAYMPYGNKSPECIMKRSMYLTKQLHKYNIDALLIACHTASASAYSAINEVFPHLRIITLSQLCVEELVYNVPSKKCAALATPATVASNVFGHLFEVQKSAPSLIQQPCEGLATAIEQGDTQDIEALLNKYVRPLHYNDIDALILGCTHYHLIADRIAANMPENTIIVAADQIVKKALSKQSIFPTINQQLHILCTGDTRRVQQVALNLLAPRFKHGSPQVIFAPMRVLDLY